MSTETVGAQQQWIPTTDSFGARLALVRHRMGWNIKEAAQKCSVAPATWRLWEIDGATPRNLITVSMTIASVTGCDYLWLVHGPNRGGAKPTDERATGPRLIATVGDPNGHRSPSSRRGPLGSRPVRQTRPASRTDHRPLTPVAV
jgi:transcriptional regulator with XRE-family HTH domain